jgi:hypothetical protein
VVRRSQLTKLVIERNRGSTISMCAMKAGVSRKTACKYLRQDNAMEQRRVPHTWRTREDPLEGLFAVTRSALWERPDLAALLKSYGTASGRFKVSGSLKDAWLPGLAPSGG